MNTPNTGKYAFLKPAIDAHTLGLISAAELLGECGYQVEIASHEIQEAIVRYRENSQLQQVCNWLEESGAEHFALSYRLDGRDAVQMLGRLLYEAQERRLFEGQGGKIRQVYYAGLPDAVALVEAEFGERIRCFSGGETSEETLKLLGVPDEKIPLELKEAGKYDESLMAFGRDLIKKQTYQQVKPPNRRYPGFGSVDDSLEKRLHQASATKDYYPIVRAHVGPYNADLSRRENVDTFLDWARDLAKAGYLDVLSVGSSQLTQSRFGESWEGEVNGGGVPLATASEFAEVWAAARPMLVRTYAGCKDLTELAKMYEDTIHIAWHAMSLWWFNRLDERGPLGLFESLQEQTEAIRYIGTSGTPFEANVSHHFAFRGSDDITYIVVAYLCAKLAKKSGVKRFVLQNMLNTPRSTWATVDLAKSRVLLKLVRELEDENFQVVWQPRAGLDYFKPDLEEARAQLAAVSCLMDDVEPDNPSSPQMIHVVSFSEAAHLADPAVINESIRITVQAIRSWRKERAAGRTMDVTNNPDIDGMYEEMLRSARSLLEAMERLIPELYSAEGFYLAFAAGFLPVPYLWRDQEKYPHAIDWKTGQSKGRVRLLNDLGHPMSDEERISLAEANLPDARVSLAYEKK